MVRRIIFVIFIAFAVAATTAGYFYLRNAKKPKKEVISLLPSDCSFIIECDNFAAFSKKLSETNLIWEELKHESYFARIDSSLNLLDSLILPDETMHKLYSEARIYIAGYETKTNNQQLYALNLPSLSSKENINEFLRKNSSAYEASETQDKHTIIRFVLKGNSKTLYAYNEEGCLLISEERDLIERALAPGTTSLGEDRHFAQLEEDGGNNMDLRIYFRNSFYASILSPDLFGQLPLKSNINWTALDFITTPNQFRLNGFIDPDSISLLSALTTQEPVEMQFTSFIPSTSSSFSFFGISDFLAFSDALQMNDSLNEILKTYSTKSEAGLRNDWNEIFAGEIALVNTSIDGSYVSFGIAAVQDNQKTADFLYSLSDTTRKYFTEDSSFWFNQGNFFNTLSCFQLNENFHCAYLKDQYIYFAENDSIIRKVISAINGYGTLAKSERFAATKESNLNSGCNYFYYNDLSLAGDEFTSMLNPAIINVFSNPSERIKKFGYAGIQLSAHKGRLLTQSCIHYNPVTKLQSLTLWEAQLDTISLGVPQILTNHKTGGKDIFISDEEGTIYLISTTGKIQWKKQLGEKLLSKVFQVDYYKNGKLQMLFNTTNYLHLIDINGNYVTGYPVKLPSPSTNPIAVYDYENNKEYRILLATENKTIYNYNISGKPVDGFNFPPSKEIIQLPIEFKRINGKDYLFAVDITGNIYATGRKGEIRINFTNTMSANCRHYFFDQGKDLSRSYFSFFDISQSTLKKLSLDNKMKELNIETDLKIKSVKFDFINEDKLIDCILSDESGFIVIDDEGNRLLNFISKEDIKPAIKTITLNGHLYFIACSASDNLRIINTEGKIQSTSDFHFSSLPVLSSFNGDGIPYLIGTFNNKVNCYEFRE